MGSIQKQVLELVDPDDDERRKLCSRLVEEIVELGARLRSLLHESLSTAKARNEKAKRLDLLLAKRASIYKSVKQQGPDSIDRIKTIAELRRISKALRTARSDHEHPSDEFEVLAFKATIEKRLCSLQALLGDDKKLPWRLRFVTDVDPNSTGGPITLGGGSIQDAQGRNVWADYCATCDLEIEGEVRRWRCFDCIQGVECEDCHETHPRHENCHPGMICEYVHPTFPRLDIKAPSLAATIDRIFTIWDKRPCFLSPCGGAERYHSDWLTYGQVGDRVRRVARLLLAEVEANSSPHVVLCFPAGSMDFYVSDLACALAGITSVGLPVQSPVPSGIVEQATTIVCDEDFRERFDPFPNLKFVNLDDAKKQEPLQVSDGAKDPPGSVYTIYYTSGSTGQPKAVPDTRETFMRDFMISGELIPCCCLSFLPPCWATDRLLVYQALFNGWRVGFSRRQPSMQQILEDLAALEPTMIVAPPLLLQFISSLHPPPDLGRRLRYIGWGGAPLGDSTRRFLAETYDVPIIEAYGCTECGGIASGGRTLPDVKKKIRLRDPQSQEWLCIEREGVIGELWVGEFNTQDLVEFTEGGNKIRVIGRSDSASAFKMANGKWCSMIDVADEIVRTCSPDLLQQAVVFRNQDGILVLVAVVPECNKEIAPPLSLLESVRQRVTLSPDEFPQAIVVTNQRFPQTETYKLQRSAVLERFRNAPIHIQEEKSPGFDVVALAAQILGPSRTRIDPARSFLENGGDSISAVKWLKEMEIHFNVEGRDWRSLLHEPLSGYSRIVSSLSPESTVSVEPPAAKTWARHILLTGATGFLGRHVLSELLLRDKDTIVVCLVRDKSQLLASDRVVVVTEVPTNLDYRQVVHLAANVNHVLSYDALKEANVDLTLDLLRLRLAPMLYCSTLSTKDSSPPFLDGYTQTKFMSEQMVLRCGGSCVWPPLLLWGNERDWLTRLVRYCVTEGFYPAENNLGFVKAAPVQVCARELVSGQQCSIWDLDLTELFHLVCAEKKLRPISLSYLLSRIASQEPPSPIVYPLLPLIRHGLGQQKRTSPDLKLLDIDLHEVSKMISAWKS